MLGSDVPEPTCRVTGEPCRLRSREAVYGDLAPGVAQCLDCSTVYEASGWKLRLCTHCKRFWGASLHDPCLGTLPNVSGACGGHGDPSQRYGVPEGLIKPGHPAWAGDEAEAAAKRAG